MVLNALLCGLKEVLVVACVFFFYDILFTSQVKRKTSMIPEMLTEKHFSLICQLNLLV